MISFDSSFLFSPRCKNGLSLSKFQKLQKLLSPFLARIHQKNLGFFSFELIQKQLPVWEKFVSERSANYDFIVVLGIGGSALGTKVLWEALGKKKSSKKFFILDNIDPDFLSEVLNQIVLKRTLFFVVSKSGSTTETLSQYLFFRDLVLKKRLALSKHFVFLTGEKSLLSELDVSRNIPTFFVPENVGGRFSVLTVVSLLPALFMEIDVRKILLGAKRMRTSFLANSSPTNLPFSFAAVQFLLGQQKKNIHVLMPYCSALKTFSEWYSQLLAESTGKKRSFSSAGFTPCSALGVTDQHSQLQLYADGPRDKAVFFLEVARFDASFEIPVAFDHPELQFLQSVSFFDLLSAEKKGTAESLCQDGCVNATFHLSHLCEETLGELFMLFMGSTAFLGEFLKINAFDQPGVERSKILTRAYLQK